MLRHSFQSLILLSVILFSGCKAVEIITPKGTYQDPIDQFQVKFKGSYGGGFNAYIIYVNQNGDEIERIEITNSFSQPWEANRTSTAESMPFRELQTGERLRMEVDGFRNSPPSISAATNSSFRPASIEVENLPLPLRQFIVREGQTITVELIVPSAPPRPWTVTVIPENDRVALGNQAVAGQPYNVTIPANDRRFNFTLRGIQGGGNCRLMIESEGYQGISNIPVLVIPR